MGLENFGQLLQTELEKLIPATVEKILEPIIVLKNFPDVLTISELAKVIREEDEKKIYDYCQRNEIPHLHLGRSLRFSKAQMIKFLLGEEFNKCKICTNRKDKNKPLPEETSPFRQPGKINEKVLRFATQ